MATEGLCYNKGCGLKFALEENMEESCLYHPGTPIFHDAYKGWSCCNNKSTDFTTFLNLPGCTKGQHNPEKPAEPIKQKIEPLKKDEVIVVRPPTQIQTPRGDFNESLTLMKFDISQSLKNMVNSIKLKTDSELSEKCDGTIKIGESCKNKGCQQTYEGDSTDTLANCKHHPGYPVFHEGIKFWTCCMKKTPDFNSFLNQKGCTLGSHMWQAKNVTKTTCRYDWHQTGSHVVMTIYAKNPNPELSRVELNQIRLKNHITFGDSQVFEMDSELYGVVDVSRSSVGLFPTKVEIKLLKPRPLSWKTLFIERPKEVEKSDETVKALGVDAIDLGDI